MRHGWKDKGPKMTTHSPWAAMCTSSFQQVSHSTFRRYRSDTEVSTHELRSCIYSDIHLRGCESAALYADLPTVTRFVDLSSHTVQSPGWNLVEEELHKEDHFILRSDQFSQSQTANGNFTVTIPRLKVNAVPGWLAIESLEPARFSAPWRLYLPGIALNNFSTLIEFMDHQDYLHQWSMKTSLSLNRNLILIPRPDATVVYFDPNSAGVGAISALVNAISLFASAGCGPGFSVQLTDSVWIGGPSTNAHTSFGSSLSVVAAKCLIANDFTELNQRESAFRNEVNALV